MNHREPPHRAAGLQRALRGISSLLLLPALVPKSVSGNSRSRLNTSAALNLGNAEPVLLPYLAVVGGPPLRFQAAPPPPDLTVRPAAPVPPHASPEASDASPASRPNDAASSETLAPAALAASKRSADGPSESPVTTGPATPTKAPPPSILPDDARPAVRPEDFLPYFQIPGQTGGVNLLVPVPRGAPAPAPLPASTATYTQSK